MISILIANALYALIIGELFAGIFAGLMLKYYIKKTLLFTILFGLGSCGSVIVTKYFMGYNTMKPLLWKVPLFVFLPLFIGICVGYTIQFFKV